MYIRQDLIFTQNYDDVVISHSDSNSELPRGAARLGSSGNEGVSGMGERTARGVIIASMIIESRRELPRMQSEEGQGCAQVKRAISFEMVRGESASKYSEIPWAQQNNVQLGGGCVAPSGMVYRWQPVGMRIDLFGFAVGTVGRKPGARTPSQNGGVVGWDGRIKKAVGEERRCEKIA